MSRRLALVALPLVLLVASLAACTETARIPPAEPPSATQPLFASDEEALEAATAAYEEYLAASNAVTSRDVLVTDELSPLVTPSYLAELDNSVAQLKEAGLRTVGTTLIRSIQLQQHFEDLEGTTVVVYACLDVSGVRVIDSQGNDQTPADRDVIVGLEVELFGPGADPEGLLIARSETWGENAPCESP